jgi:hypothetical protein
MVLPMFTVNDEAVGPHQPGRAAPDDEGPAAVESAATAQWRDYFVAARQGLVPGPLRFVRAIGSCYLPGFHPSQLGGVERAVDYLASRPQRASRTELRGSNDHNFGE